jgi:hypothetical protein
MNPTPVQHQQPGPSTHPTPVLHQQNPVPPTYPTQVQNQQHPGPPAYLNTSQSPHQGPTPHVTLPGGSSPPIPERNNTRNRLELDSVSPAIQRPNPMETPVSPITPGSPSNRDRANFSYPSRAPPQGVPRQVPAQLQPGKPLPSHQQPTPEQWGQAWNSQQHTGYDNEASRPVPFRVGHSPSQPHPPQKQPTLANLKAAAHGIHVRSDLKEHVYLIALTSSLIGRRRSSPRHFQQHRRSPLRPSRRRCSREKSSDHRCRSRRNRVTELRTPPASASRSGRTASALHTRQATVHGASSIRVTDRRRRWERHRQQDERLHEEVEGRTGAIKQRWPCWHAAVR